MEDLKHYHKSFYSSNIMNLVLVGRHSLDDMQKYAEENFSQIENKDISHCDWTKEVCFDEEHSFGRIFKMIPAKQMKSMTLKFSLPGQLSLSDEKSGKYLSHVFGHEGPNSLLSCLIKEGLATALTAGNSTRLNEAMDQFAIGLSLTEKGEQEYLRVLEVVFMFINQIRHEGPQEYIYNEIKNKYEIDWGNTTKSQPIRYS